MDKNIINYFKEDYFSLLDIISNIPRMNIKLLPAKKTVLVLMNMTVGFIKESLIVNKSFKTIIEPVQKLLLVSKERGIPAIAFADRHTEDSTEFLYFPKHCMENTESAEIIDEIKDIGGYTTIYKNSLNAFHSPKFKKFLDENSDVKNFIVCGVATDIGVMNFCLTLKSYFDEKNKKVNIIVPYSAVETFESNVHNNDFANIFALQHMASQGIEIVKEIY